VGVQLGEGLLAVVNQREAMKALETEGWGRQWSVSWISKIGVANLDSEKSSDKWCKR